MIVKYSKKFPYAPYLNEDIGFELEIDMPKMNEELILATLYSLKSIAEKFHKDNNQQLGYDSLLSKPDGSTWNPQTGILSLAPEKPLQSIDRKAIERLEILIDDAKTIDELLPLEEEVSKNGLREYYVKKWNALVCKPTTP